MEARTRREIHSFAYSADRAWEGTLPQKAMESKPLANMTDSKPRGREYTVNTEQLEMSERVRSKNVGTFQKEPERVPIGQSWITLCIKINNGHNRL